MAKPVRVTQLGRRLMRHTGMQSNFGHHEFPVVTYRAAILFLALRQLEDGKKLLKRDSRLNKGGLGDTYEARLDEQ